jgi:hypothetical protein
MTPSAGAIMLVLIKETSPPRDITAVVISLQCAGQLSGFSGSSPPYQDA